MDYTIKQIKEWKEKAKKWDALDKKIATFYQEEEGDEIDAVCAHQL